MSTIFKRFAALLLVLALTVPMAACQKTENEAQKVMDTEAVSVGDYKLSAAELNYFYMDAISDWYAEYGNYASMMGFDPTKPLNEQAVNSSTGETWADSFLSMALENIESTYALYDLAMKNGFTLSDADQKALDVVVEELEALIKYYSELYSSMGYTYPYTDVQNYLETIYGVGANAENYAAYCRVCTIANAYYEAYGESLSYTNKQLREYEADKYARYCSYSFTVYYVSVSDYDNAEAALNTAQQLAAGNYADKDAFDAAIKELPINANKEAPTLSEAYTSILYAQVTKDYIDWLADETRMPGDMGVVVKETTSGEETIVKGYYVVRFDGVSDNQILMKNVRYILIEFEGGTTNSLTGITTYPEEKKAEAKKEAEKLLVEFIGGNKTEMRFGDLANKHSDDSDGSDGGLAENLYPGLLLPAIEEWCFNPKRIPGDTGLVETDRGWYLMYFVSNSEITFRDYMLTNDLRIEDISAWYDALLENTTIELLDDTYVNKSMILSR